MDESRITETTIYEAPLDIHVKYHYANLPKLTYVDGKSDWIDLSNANAEYLKKGEFKIINLGVTIKLPTGYEALLVPRSSTFKKYGIIQTNSVGVIDETYCGDDDMWGLPVYATRDIVIPANTRLCQFRVFRHQPSLNFIEDDVDVSFRDGSRGGFGSTGER